MRPPLARTLILTLALLAAACDQSRDKSRPEPAAASPAMAPQEVTADAPAGGLAREESRSGAPQAQQPVKRDARNRYLAYEHNLNVRAPEARIAPLYQQVREACEKEVAEQCVVLSSNLSTAHDTTASLRLRAGPAAIARLGNLLDEAGEVMNRGTRAENLSRAIEDTGTRMAMLTDYRTRLEALRERAGSNIDTLIRLNQELAQVQSQIEGASGQRAGLMQRVDTEILAVNIYSSERSPAWRQLGDAVRNFGANLTSGTAGVINTVAYLAPAVVALGLFFWVLRALWKRVRRQRVAKVQA